MKTIVALGHRQFGEQQFTHGSEIPPDLLPAEVVDYHVDRKELVEYNSAEHRSLYRLFAKFSGCSERERLSRQELAEYALTS